MLFARLYERFATAALVNIPTAGRAAVHLVNCGHLTPLAISRRGVRPLKEAVWHDAWTVVSSAIATCVCR